MGRVISFVSQKGGVGKSTLARAFAREASQSGLSVKVADLDTQQGTFADWHRQRLDNGFDPVGSVEVFREAIRAIKEADKYDLLIIDGQPRASAGTLDIAKYSNLIVLPACSSRDDLIPAIKLAFSLKKKGVERKRIGIALSRVTTQAEIRDARDFIAESGLFVFEGCLYEKPAYRQAQNDGLSVTETRYKSLNRKADRLLDSIAGKLLEYEIE